MDNRWHANKIGLINFWYYDEQEFPFVKGRMLLRGANGSGKSVTMQSVVPLLLDGNMSPERLDPFGSRDRKMSSYLLEEDDAREERTGYLYLEFKREKCEQYLTVGMGIRARKRKPLEKWYFSLTDGRRIGKDFLLYKETDEKVTLSKKELENRIRDGGRVFDRQADYMEYVNQQIFGFETVEEYKEMIDLLIQLRTPKLSKDFKPSVINEILSDSLQPLSDEELRPMSEAIENMDTMSMNLKNRQEAKQAADKINRVLEKYHKVVLYEKAEHYEECKNRLSELEKEARNYSSQVEIYEKRVQELRQEKIELEARKEAMEKEKDSLSKSDAVNLKKRSMELETAIAGNEEVIAEKQKQLQAKQEQFLEIEKKQKEDNDRAYQKEQELLELLEEMQTEADEMCFEEHAFFCDEFKEKIQEKFGFDTHQQQFERTSQGILKGVKVLKEVELQRRQYEAQLQKRESHQRKTDTAQRQVQELEATMTQIRNEWKEALYHWNGKNKELILSKDFLKELSMFAENYDEKADYGKVRSQVADVWIQNKNILETELSGKQIELKDAQADCEEQKSQLAEWENHKEPEPFRTEEVIHNRKTLQEHNIPYLEFYKVLEFGPELDKRACDRLEEALLRMGILDALVVEEQYREEILSLNTGGCDKYLFVQEQHVENSILNVLELNDLVNDIFFNQRIINILGNIAYDGQGVTSISKDGTYRLGVLTGTVMGNYEAGFLGSKAREENRQAKIRECQKNIASLEETIESLSKQIEHLQERRSQLEQEYEGFPSDEDLKEAYQMLKSAETMVEQLKQEGLRLEEELREISEKLQGFRKAALQIAETLYLPCNYDAFERAEDASRAYEKYLIKLKAGHEIYLQILEHLEELAEHMEELDADMDQIRYDAGNAERQLKNDQQEYQSILEQLALTDYEEIKDRLDSCMQWLKEYPRLLEECIGESKEKAADIKVLKTRIQNGADQIQEYKRKNDYLKKCYEAERLLGYVLIPDEIGDVAQVRKYLSAECKGLQKGTVNNDLNKVYYENRGMLNDYQLMQIELFEELEAQMKKGDPSPKRMDIQARYQGTKLPFHKLSAYLEEEIVELQELIKAGDRELFEDILANTVSRKIRGKINSSYNWVDKMNNLMGAMNTSSSLKLSLRWRSKTAEDENQLDTQELVDLLKKDYRLMREDEAEKLSMHFRSKVQEARRHSKDSGGMVSFYQVMKDTLDYRKWFEFQILVQKNGEKQKVLTNSVFGTFSGGEKAMSMYVPLFSAVVAKYQGGRADAPRLISLDEAFAGVDNKNIREMFQLMTECQFDFIINSQVLWGDCDTLDALAIYQLLRPENAKFVTVMPYLWNGKSKEMLDNERAVEERGKEYFTA